MKKSITMILSAAMAFSMLSSAAYGAGAAKSAADFNDLQSLDGATKAKFDAMISAGVFDGVGDGVFGLKDKMNRAQFAKVAALIFGLQVDNSLKVSSFADVKADDPANGYALSYIEALRQAKLTDGFGVNVYNPAGEVTKEQLAAFLLRGLNKDAAAKAALGVSDATVSDWARGYAALAVQLKLMGNEADGMFGGASAATRELLVTSSYEAKQQYVPGSRTQQGSGSGNASGAGELSTGDLPTNDLTSSIQAQVKGVLQEKLVSGWRFGASIKLINTTGDTVRIPDYELRVKASDGNVYTLPASSDNARAIAPNSLVELSYLTEVNKTSDVNLTDLQWVDVDYEVYPKKETQLATASIGSFVWRGADAVIQDASLMGGWGVNFSVPGETSPLKYSASNLSKQFAGQAPTYIVQLKVENPGSYAATVPDFTLGGKAEGKSYIGKRIETSPVTVNPGEQKYINFAVTTEPDTQLTGFYVLSSHNFVKQGAPAPVQYYTGRIGFKLPSASQTAVTLPPYQMGSPIAIDSLSKAVNPQTEVALQDFDWFENDGQSYKTAVAKIKFTNKSDSTIPVPQIGAEIVSGKGVSYTGSPSSSAVKDVLPGMGAVSTYAFVVPNSEDASQFTFRFMEQQGQQAAAAQPPVQSGQQGQQAASPAQGQAAPSSQLSYKTPIAQVNVTMKTLNQIGNVYSFYPYELKMDNYHIANYANQNALTHSYGYSYKLEMGLDIKTTDAVVADPSNPKLLFQLEGPGGKRLGSKTYALAGDNRLLSGTQNVMFDSASDQLESPISIKVYEVISTPFGDARRLLTILKS